MTNFNKFLFYIITAERNIYIYSNWLIVYIRFVLLLLFLLMVLIEIKKCVYCCQIRIVHRTHTHTHITWRTRMPIPPYSYIGWLVAPSLFYLNNIQVKHTLYAIRWAGRCSVFIFLCLLYGLCFYVNFMLQHFDSESYVVIVIVCSCPFVSVHFTHVIKFDTDIYVYIFFSYDIYEYVQQTSNQPTKVQLNMEKKNNKTNTRTHTVLKCMNYDYISSF